MESLPNEIFLVILQELNNYELTLIRTVSRKWNQFIISILEKYSTDIIDCIVDGNYYWLTKNYKMNKDIFGNNYYTSLIYYTDHRFLDKLFTGKQKMNIDECLIEGSDSGHFNVIKLLLKKGADLHAKNDFALRRASRRGHLEVVKLLLERGADLHVDDDWALRWASYNDHFTVVKLLLEKGANLHAGNDFAFRWASNHGHFQIVRLLLEKGANLHADNDGALRWASSNGHLEVVQLLLKKGANSVLPINSSQNDTK